VAAAAQVVDRQAHQVQRGQLPQVELDQVVVVGRATQQGLAAQVVMLESERVEAVVVAESLVALVVEAVEAKQS
jgi:hypothetical protein